jgi:1-acyl-sn-glycerol-3-phosphate acyltransferase
LYGRLAAIASLEDPLRITDLVFPALRYSLGSGMRMAFRPQVTGKENIPTSGAAIIASNHLAFLDSFFLPLVAPRAIHFLAKAEYFTGTGPKGRAMAGFFTGVGAIPVDRAGGRAAVAALNAGLDVLKDGELFGIYPEGTRSPDGRLYKGRTGVAHLALQTGVPVIPACVIDTNKVQPDKDKPLRLRPVKVTIKFGEPLDFGKYADMPSNRHVIRAVTDEVVDAIRALSGQEYVDRYASTPAPLTKK